MSPALASGPGLWHVPPVADSGSQPPLMFYLRLRSRELSISDKYYVYTPKVLTFLSVTAGSETLSLS